MAKLHRIDRKMLKPFFDHFDGGAVPWKKRMVDTSDGAERKRNQKYGANRVERTNRAMENQTTLALTQCSMTYMCALTIRSW